MGVEGVIHFKIWEVLFRDMGGAVLRYGRCCIRGWRGGIHPEIWEVLFRDMGGASEPVDCLARVRYLAHAVFLDLQNVRES